MQAIIIASRSINQDQFFQKQAEEKYKKHITHIKSITGDKGSHLQEWKHQVDNLVKTFRKSKSAAKEFRKKQQKTELNSKNKLLLKRIWNLKPSVNIFNEDRFQYVSGSNWSQQKKKLSQIKEENQRLSKHLLLIGHVEKKQYKKKVKQSIQEYEQLRNSIRKIKDKDFKIKRSQSERKLSAGLKLKRIDSKENIINKETKNIKDQKEEIQLSPQIQQSTQIKLV